MTVDFGNLLVATEVPARMAPVTEPPETLVSPTPPLALATDDYAVDESSSHAVLRAVVDEPGDESAIPRQALDIDTDYTLPQFDPPMPFTPEELEEVRSFIPDLYLEFLDCFHPRQALETLAPRRHDDLRINLIPNARLRIAPLYELSVEQSAVLKETIDRELAAGRIRPSKSVYGSPVFFVKKKDGRWRMVVDYRVLNAATIPDVYPLPLISQVYNDLGNSKFYTCFDICSAYQQERMAEDSIHLTAFRTQYGMFESTVVRDGLKNAPPNFQSMLNSIFADLLAAGVIVYIDDIIVHAPTLERLRELTIEVLRRIRKAGIFLKASKSLFERTSVKFLGVLVSGNGIAADPDYVRGVSEYPPPTTITGVRRFLGLAGYYRRFVPKFSSIAGPLHALTCRDTPFVWGDPQQQAFDEIKSRLTTSPVLAHFNPLAETIVQTDASLFAWGFVISQIDPVTLEEHPIAMESGAFKHAEVNWTTTDKEFYAIVAAFSRKRHILLQVSSTVITDHLNLQYWMEPRQLNSRQARWVEHLSGFSFRIVYRPGSRAMFPDALSRREDYNKSSIPDHDDSLVQALPPLDESSTVGSTLGHMLRAIVPTDEEEEEVDDRAVLSLEDLTEGLVSDPDLDKVRDELMVSLHAPRVPSLPMTTFLSRLGFDGCVAFGINSTGLLLVANRIYVPSAVSARTVVLRMCHESPLAGHQGIDKTLDLVRRQYCWVGCRRDTEAYVKGCAVCQRTKPSRQRPHGLLQPLEVADVPWSSVSMDFIEPLPPSNGFDSILVIVDRLTKFAIFIPTHTTLTAAGLADLIFDRLICEHGYPRSIVSDRGSKFTSDLWRGVTAVLDISLRLSTSFHPQTDGQTERVNQVLEQYLRVFCTYKQDNWSTLLQRAAFSYNNAPHATTLVSPFFANYGFAPRFLPDSFDFGDSSDHVVEKVSALADVHDLCRQNIDIANADYARHYDKSRQPGPTYEVGDQVLLSLENIKTKRPSKKLDIRRAGPYTIAAKVGPRAYRLDLPDSMRIHNVFHVSLIRPFAAPTIPGQSYDPPGPVETVDDDDDSYEVASILDSKVTRGRLLYQVEWSGYEMTDDATGWEPASNLDNCSDLIDAFHAKHPDKPGPDDPRIKSVKPRRVAAKSKPLE